MTMRTQMIEGFEVALFDDASDPYIPDVELGKRLGFERPRKIRDLIRRWHKAGALRDIRCAQPRDSAPHRGARVETISSSAGNAIPKVQYFLGEADALFIVTKSETPLATKLTQQIIDVFMSWRRGHLPQPKTDPAIGQALVAIQEELKAHRILSTHIAKAVGILLPSSIIREAKSHNRSRSSLEKSQGLELHVRNLFELGKTYDEIVASVQHTFHLKITKSSLSRAYHRWTVRTGRTAWSPRLTLLS